MTINSHKALEVWQKGVDLATESYRLATLMPKSEAYRLISQVMSAAISVPANSAEGHDRGSRKEYAQPVSMARGSPAEVGTPIPLAIRAGLQPETDATAAPSLADHLGRQRNVLHKRLIDD